MTEEEATDRSTASRAVDYAIVHILAESPSLADAGPELLARIGEQLGWETGAIWRVEDEGALLRCVATWKAPGIDVDDFEELTRSISFAPGVGLPGRVWASGEPRWIVDVTHDVNFPRAAVAAEAGLHGAFAFPIQTRGRILGVIEFFTRQAPHPDRELLDMMAAAGSQIGQFMERKQAEEDVRKSAALKTAMLEAALDCVVAIDHRGNVIEFNPAAERTFGYKRKDVIGKELAALLIPPHLRDRHRKGLARYVVGAESNILDKLVELPAMRADGSEFPAELAITRIGDEEPPMFTGYIRDITERKQSEEALAFIARASSALDESLDLNATLNTVARLAVPYLADGCMVDLKGPDGSIQQVASAAADPSMEPVLDELRRHPIDPRGPHPIARAMRTGELQIVPDISETFLREIAASEQYYEALRRWPARAVVVAPMEVRGKLLGTMACASFSPERAYTANEMSLICELARRAASTVENALLFEERSRLARTLQQSFLPLRLPEIPGAEIAARFQPGHGNGEVGGDFYDVFEANAGWTIAVGEVSGRGIETATATTIARHTIRAAAMRESSPARMLEILNEALRLQLDGSRFCTAVLALLDIGEADARLRLASAGHPLPLLLRPDGSVETIGRTGTLLGVLPDPKVVEEEIDLSASERVVFYTDGVSETRGEGGGFGIEELTTLVGTCVDLDATATAECIDDAVEAARKRDSHDDAVILVLRIPERLAAQTPSPTSA